MHHYSIHPDLTTISVFVCGTEQIQLPRTTLFPVLLFFLKRYLKSSFPRSLAAQDDWPLSDPSRTSILTSQASPCFSFCPSVNVILSDLQIFFLRFVIAESYFPYTRGKRTHGGRRTAQRKCVMVSVWPPQTAVALKRGCGGVWGDIRVSVFAWLCM